MQSSPDQQQQPVIKSMQMSPLLLKWCQHWANNTQNKALVLRLTNLSRNGEDFALNNYSAKCCTKKFYMGVKYRIKFRNEDQKSGLDFLLSAFLSAYAVCLKYQEFFHIHLKNFSFRRQLSGEECQVGFVFQSGHCSVLAQLVVNVSLFSIQLPFDFVLRGLA